MDVRAVAGDLSADGCAVVRGFVEAQEQNALKQGILALVEEWADQPPKEGAVFKTDESQRQAQGAEDYFISSGDKVRFFWEAGAVQERGENASETLLRLNKIGHGLHLKSKEQAGAAFGEYARSEKVRRLVQGLGYQRPVLPQSMYIVKNPKIGGEVTAHQDSTFLFVSFAFFYCFLLVRLC